MAKRISDDEVLDWWEAYEEGGLSIPQVAAQFGRAYETVRRHFIELGILENRGETYRGETFTWGPGQAEAIQTALDRIDVDAFSSRRHLPFAQALPHVKPRRRPKIVQSARQRQQDRMATSLWRTLVRQDMKRSGIM